MKMSDDNHYAINEAVCEDRPVVNPPRRGAFVGASVLVAGVLMLVSLWGLGRAVAPVRAQGPDGFETYYVAPGANCNGATPCYASVQAAVDAVDDPGDVIKVAAGTYSGVETRAGMVQVVYISKTLTVHGGYTVADWDTQDPVGNPTTLDAQGLGRVLAITGSLTGGSPPTVTVEGLRMTGGNATGLGRAPVLGADAGGGVYAYTATVTLADCVIYDNVASTTPYDPIDPTGGYGGGLYMERAEVTLTANTVQSNTASTGSLGLGGGLDLEDSVAVIQGNTFQENIASTADEGVGGGLYVYFSDALIENNRVLSNTAGMSSSWAGYGGGLYVEMTGATLSGNTVQGNVAGSAGVGLGGGIYLDASGVLLEGNVVRDNVASAAADGYGGGLEISLSDALLEDNVIVNNVASTAMWGYGGGLDIFVSIASLEGNEILSNTASLASDGYGGGVLSHLSEVLTLTNNLVAGNDAANEGSGLWVGGAPGFPVSSYLVHNTFADNGGVGQGIYISSTAHLTFANTIIAGHSGAGIAVTTGSTATLENTLWYDNAANVAGAGQIDRTNDVAGDPAFADPGAWDYHLGIGSAALDAGVDAGVTYDIDGDRRPIGDWPDIGADEATPVVTLTKRGPARFNPGVRITYTLEITNTGVVTASDALLTDTLPAGSSFVWAGDGGLAGNGVVTWFVSSIPAGGGVVTRAFAVAATDTVTNEDYRIKAQGISVVTGTVAVRTALNRAPIADAGGPQTAHDGTITLQGDGSGDPDGDALTYGWRQAGGAAVTLSDSTAANPTFPSPEVGGLLTFTLTVTDPFGLSATDVTTVTITNDPPAADAGPDQVASTDVLVTLDGRGSSDPENDVPLTYHWAQIGGTAVTLVNPAAPRPLFRTPLDPTVLTFTLAVSDSWGLAAPSPDTVVVTVTNQAPVADAGGDQTVDTGVVVALDGSGSADPDGDLPLSYQWTQTGGTAVAVGDATAISPTFTAPADPAVLTFTLTVTDSLGLASAPDEVVITVTNQAPVADAGDDQDVETGVIVTLDGSGSADPDGDLPLSYQWTQTGGTAVAVGDATAISPTFTAPADPAVLTFTLTVTDSLGLASAPDEVVVRVGNRPPVADAGVDQSVKTRATVKLDGGGSTDPDGDLPLRYRWTQTGGPAVVLSDATAISPTFAAPGEATSLTFTLVVTDSRGLASAPDAVVVVVAAYRAYMPVIYKAP